MKQIANLLIVFMSMMASQMVFSQNVRNYTKDDYEEACYFYHDISEDPFWGDNYNVFQFYEGLASVRLKDDKSKWGFINNFGKEIARFEYLKCKPFAEGLAAVLIKKDKYSDAWGYINNSGKVVIPAKYEEAGIFSEGFAAIKTNGKYGYINKQGIMVIPNEYDKADSFSEGYAVVKKNGKYGFINKLGKLIIPCKYDIASSFSDGLAAVGFNKNYGFINKQGVVIISLDKYEYGWLGPGRFKNGYAEVAIKSGHGTIWIDKKGNNITKSDMAVASPQKSIYDGIYVYQSSGKQGLKKLDGTIILSPTYDSFHKYQNGYFSVKNNGKYGVIDKSGKMVVPCKYGYIWDMSEDMFVVKNEEGAVKLNGKYAFVNSQGKQITPFIFDYTHGFNCGFATIVINGKLGYIDKNGSPLKIDFSGETYYMAGMDEEKFWKPEDPSTNKYLDKAFEFYKKGANKGNKYSCFKVGWFYFWGKGNVQKNYLEAAKWLEKNININGETNGLEYLYLGTLYKNGGFGLAKNEAKAIKYFTDGAHIKKNAGCYNQLAFIYASKKSYNLALDNIDKAIQASSGTEKANYYDSKGEIFLMMGKTNEAIQMWNKVMELDKDNLDFYKDNSELYKQLKAKGLM